MKPTKWVMGMFGGRGTVNPVSTRAHSIKNDAGDLQEFMACDPFSPGARTSGPRRWAGLIRDAEVKKGPKSLLSEVARPWAALW